MRTRAEGATNCTFGPYWFTFNGYPGRMNRWSRLALGAVAVVLLVSSCKRQDNTAVPVQEEDRIVQSVTVLEDPSMLQVTWDPVECETFQNVEVELDDDYANLRIRVLVDVENCPPGGFDQATVDLGEPLGDRQVWDRAFGNTVALQK